MQILTIALGLILLYLILSLITTAIQESLSSWLALRGKYMWSAVHRMLSSSSDYSPDAVDNQLVKDFEAHAHYKNLCYGAGKEGRHPSYLKAETFASILMSILDGNDIKKLKSGVAGMKDGGPKRFLEHLISESNDDLTAFRTRIETWYDEVMARVGGAYKRMTHSICMLIGFVICLALNADTLSVYQKMVLSSQQPTQTAGIVDLAQTILGASGENNLGGNVLALESSLDSVAALPATDSSATAAVDRELMLLRQASALITEVSAGNSPLGIGWTKKDWESFKAGGLPVWISKLFGLLITTMAISLGAPFWFDLLKKIMNVRNAGPKVKAVVDN